MGAASWEIESVVKEAQKDVPDPGGGPPTRLLIPPTVRSQVLQWGHSSKLTCHPGAHRTLIFLRHRFWWLGMARETREFVAACSVCARSKASHQLPARLLRSLPSPWSHIAVDFVTGLPPCGGNTVVLTIIDCFSKAVHYVPLPKLPSVLETADLLTNHVFKLYGIPIDIVSDRGPQFAFPCMGRLL